MKKICIITNKYPNKIEPNVLVFVQQLVWEMADLGVKCSVICPVPININPRYLRFPNKKIEITENGSQIDIFFPKYIGFGDSHYIFGKSPAVITTYFFTKAVKRIIKKLSNKPDAVYGHFVEPAGIATARIGKYFQIPAFMAYGEATTKTIEHFGPQRASKELSSLSGVIAVSTQNKEMLSSMKTVSKEKIGVFPNGYRKERFYKRDKKESREKFGFPKEKFIVGFVGSFDHRKGIDRLIQAAEKSEDIYVACAGKGKLMPNSNKCVYSSPVKNSELPFFYSAVDVFVLPTLNEGCCNAIIEAMACGLPVVSSNLAFNDDILDDSCSIRIDPNNVNQIGYAIQKLRDDIVLKENLSKGSIEKAKELTITNRAKRIIEYIDKKSMKNTRS